MILKAVLVGLLLLVAAALVLALGRWCWIKLWERALGYRGDHAG